MPDRGKDIKEEKRSGKMDKKLYGTYTRFEYNPESGPQAMMDLVIKGINRLAKKMSAWDIVPDFDTIQFISHIQEKHKYDFDWYLEDEEPQKEEVKYMMTIGVKFNGEPKKDPWFVKGNDNV